MGNCHGIDQDDSTPHGNRHFEQLKKRLDELQAEVQFQKQELRNLQLLPCEHGEHDRTKVEMLYGKIEELEEAIDDLETENRKLTAKVGEPTRRHLPGGGGRLGEAAVLDFSSDDVESEATA